MNVYILMFSTKRVVGSKLFGQVNTNDSMFTLGVHSSIEKLNKAIQDFARTSDLPHNSLDCSKNVKEVCRSTFKGFVRDIVIYRNEYNRDENVDGSNYSFDLETLSVVKMKLNECEF